MNSVGPRVVRESSQNVLGALPVVKFSSGVCILIWSFRGNQSVVFLVPFCRSRQRLVDYYCVCNEVFDEIKSRHCLGFWKRSVLVRQNTCLQLAIQHFWC